jgi:hypothetical protein
LCESGVVGAPLALIHPGSGPTDRNGDNPLGVAAQPYRLLAHALADHGVDTLRVDKRGMHGSAQAGDANALTLDDYAADIHAWLDALKRPRVALIGHSEGGMSVTLAAQGEPRVAALVLLCAPGRPLAEIMRAQFRGNPYFAPVLEAALAATATLERGAAFAPAGLPAALRLSFAASAQPFLINAMARDPARVLAATRAPALIVQGGRDIQVFDEDAERLAAARDGVERADFAAMTHALKDCASDDRLANLLTYARPDLPLSAGLAQRVADFLRAHL